MARNRIVISLDPNQRRGRRAVGRLLLVLALILLLVIGGLGAGGYFWWRHYQGGPSYALAVLADAAQRGDNATVDSILDTQKISGDFVSQVRQRVPGSSLSSLLPSQVDALRSTASSRLTETVHEQLLNEIKDLTDIAAGKPFVVIAVAVPYFVTVKQTDRTAEATVKLKNEQVELTMQNANDQWRVVAVRDEKLTAKVAEAIGQSVPANGDQLPDQIRKQLNRLNK